MKPGDQLGPVEHGPITTRQLVEYAAASLDWNRIHYDEPFAKAAGFPSVIAHGMLSMAFFGSQVARLVGPRNVLALSARFKAVTFPGDTVRVSGEVLSAADGTAVLKLEARRSDGTVTLEGSATVRI